MFRFFYLPLHYSWAFLICYKTIPVATTGFNDSVLPIPGIFTSLDRVPAGFSEFKLVY